MEERNRYQLTIDGNVSEYTQGCISGVIFGVTNTTYLPAMTIKSSVTGLWIFKRRKITSVSYTFEATEDEANGICGLIQYLYGKDEIRDFGFGIKPIKEEA